MCYTGINRSVNSDGNNLAKSGIAGYRKLCSVRYCTELSPSCGGTVHLQLPLAFRAQWGVMMLTPLQRAPAPRAMNTTPYAISAYIQVIFTDVHSIAHILMRAIPQADADWRRQWSDWPNCLPDPRLQAACPCHLHRPLCRGTSCPPRWRKWKSRRCRL